MATTWNAFYLGNVSTALDPTEGNNVAENLNHAAFRQTYGSASNPLWGQVHSVQTRNTFGAADSLDLNNTASIPIITPVRYDEVLIDRNGDGVREVYQFDACAQFNVRITYFDGTTATTQVVLFQTTNGDLYLAPPPTGAPGNAALTAKAITSLTVTSAVAESSGNLLIDRQVTEFACFAAGVMIRTPAGDVAVETLAEGDLVTTVDHGPLPIRWIGQAEIDLQANPKLRPIRIRAGALGQGMPEADLIVSPQHRVLVRSKIAQRMFGTDEVLVAAKQLLELDGIDLAEDLDKITYVHFLFDQHQVVWSNGALTESLFTGAEALRSVGPVAREEIFSIFPELRDQDGNTTRAPVRPLIGGRQARQMASRHAGNGKRLVG